MVSNNISYTLRNRLCTGCGVCPSLGVHNVIQGVRS